MEPWRRSLPVVLLAVGVGTAMAWSSRVAAQVAGGAAQPGAQIQVNAGNGLSIENQSGDSVFLPAERTVLQQFNQARELLPQGRYGEAVRLLGAILDGPEDYFFQPDKKQSSYRSLKAEAQRLIGEMPPQGRELYELQYGARAQQMLAAAVNGADRARLAEVSRRCFHTSAGYEATFLLGLDHLDHARPLAAALTFERLSAAPEAARRFEPTLSLALATCWLQVGQTEKAQAVLSALKQQRGNAPIKIAGKEVALFDKEPEALAWLAERVGTQRTTAPGEPDRWTMYRGNPARNAAANASAPLLNVRWRVTVADDPATENQLQELRRYDLEQGAASMPGLHPLAVDDVVLMRTVRNLLAVDFLTGKRLWEVPVDDSWETTANANTADDPFIPPQSAPGLGYRLADDATYGTISSDGQFVFTIEDLEGNTSQTPLRRPFIGARSQNNTPPPFNRLAAHEIRTGKLKWHLGGPADQYALRQAGTFFLGPPLPLMGQLYVLAEVKEEIRLLALDARTGELLWSQQLALAEPNPYLDSLRRAAGASPSYSDGILVCPTANGAIVAVELATRSLLWGYRYDRPRSPNTFAPMVMPPGAAPPGAVPTGRWTDASVTLAEECVLATPMESDSLHCLNLADGTLRWKYRRQDDLYVACVHQGKVVLVGNHQVRALSLTETTQAKETVETTERSGSGITTRRQERTVSVPRPAWDGRTVALPEGSTPSGRGFLGGDHYFVPVSSAEVVAIDLAAGKAGQVSKSRKGFVPGNLICYRGMIISQGLESVDAFYQLDAVRQQVEQRLAAKADDAEALSLRGEILLDEGKQSEAIACFRRAYELDSDPRTRDLLRDALLDGLRTDFATHCRQAAEIERLLDDPAERATYLRLMAGGLRQAGEVAAALQHYLRLIDLDQEQRGLEPVSKSLSVRRDRWIQGQLAALRAEAKDQAGEIDRAVEGRLQAALAAADSLPLRRFLDYFGHHPTAGRARHDLFRRLKNAGQLLEAELVLWPEAQSPDRNVAGPAVAELAEMYQQVGRLPEAAICYGRLGRELADVVCRAGKIGKDLWEALPADGPIRHALAHEVSWPAGNVVAKNGPSRRAQVGSLANFALPYQGSRAPFFSDIALRFDQNRQQIVACDGLGNTRWQIAPVEPGSRQPVYFNYNITTGRVCGHLLLLSMGQRVAAIDTLGPADSRRPKLLWGQDLVNPSLDAARLRRGPIHVFNPWQFAENPYYPGNNSGALGPVTSRHICFQRYRSLVAADPLSGDCLWIRQDVPLQSTLFGDDEMIFALAPNQAEALVFRALDGELLGKRKVPRGEQAPAASAPGGILLTDGGVRYGPAVRQYGLATLGRNILAWQAEGDGRVLELFDLWQERAVWRSAKFSRQAKTALVGQEAIGVMDRDGRFVMLSLGDGRALADLKLPPEKDLLEIFLVPSGDQYMLVTHSPARESGGNRRITQALPGGQERPIRSGHVYSFDKEGKLLWPEPVKIEYQQLLLNQPGRLPVFTFACQVFDQRKQGGAGHQVSVLCLDKRTGRKVFRGSFPAVAATLEITGDPQKKSVELLYQQGVTLTFTDDPIVPLPEEGPDEAADEEEGISGLPEALQPPKAVRGILRALEDLLIKPPAQPPKPLPKDAPNQKPKAKPPAAEKPAEKPPADKPAEARKP